MTDISELFARDPLSLTRSDVSAIVARYREARGQFIAGNMKAGSAKPKTAKQAQAESLAEKLDIKLEL